jgi:short-subunit dehydrogenase
MKKVILVTGASSGMGKDFALRLLEEGHIVYGAARREDKMKDILDKGGHIIAMDVTNPAQVEAAVEKIISEQKKIDVLINNAGFAVYGAVETVEIEDARRQFDVNLFGLADLTKKVVPHMRKEGKGTVINISSMGGKIYTPLGAWYHATKHALEGWSDCLRLELKPFGIDVVIIEPGGINSEFGDVLYDPMIQRSRGTVYEEITKSVADSTVEMYKKETLSSPAVITKLIVKAVNSKTPKTRYVAGKFAKPMLFLRKWLSDRMFDRIIMSQIK